MAALHAPIAMPAQGCSATTGKGVEHLAMLPRKVGSVVLPESVSRGADDVGHLKGKPIHRFCNFLERCTSLGLETSMASSGLGTACKWRRDKCR